MSTPEQLAKYRESKRRWKTNLTEKNSFNDVTLFMDNIENMLRVIRNRMMMLDLNSSNFKQEFDQLSAEADALVKIMKIRDGVRNK